MLNGFFEWLSILMSFDVLWSSPDTSGSGDVTAMEGGCGMPPKP
jgi:hypothetical protein